MRCVTPVRLLATLFPALLVVCALGCKGEPRAEIKEQSSSSTKTATDDCRKAMESLDEGSDKAARFDTATRACRTACDAGDQDACKLLSAAETIRGNDSARAAAAAGGAGTAGPAATGSAAAGSAAAGSAQSPPDPKMIQAAKRGGAALHQQQERGKQKAASGVEPGSRPPSN
jgi:hypothetical protein